MRDLALRLGLGAAMVAGLTACSPGSNPSVPIETLPDAWDAAGKQPNVDDQKVGEWTEFGKLCSDRTHFSQAASNVGAGPHPIALYDASLLGDNQVSVFLPAFPKSSELPQPGTSADDPITADSRLQDLLMLGFPREKVQLVACAAPTREQDGTGVIATCSVRDRISATELAPPIDVPLSSVNFELKVYEARTGAELGSSRFRAEDPTCPEEAHLDDQNPKLFSDPADRQYVAALAPYVNG